MLITPEDYFMKTTPLRMTLLIIAICALLSAAVAQSDKPKNEIEVRAQVTVPSGEANYSGTGAGGSTLDFSRDFDFKNEFAGEFRYAYRTTNGKHKIVVDYDQVDWERNTILTRSFTFRGETYVANATIDGNLKLKTFRAMYAYRWGNEKVRFGPMFDMGVIKTSLEITGTTANGTRTGEGSITKFAATVGYDVDYDPTPKLNLFHNLGGIVFKKDHLFHTEGGVKYYFNKNVGAVGGYKYQWYKFEDGPNFLTISQHGPFFGGVFRF
jgi:hypothetical protein